VSPTRGGARLQDPRWLLFGLAFSVVVFLLAISRHGKAPDQTDLPPLPTRPLPLGRPDPAAARAHVGEFLQVDLHPAPDDHYGTVISQSKQQPVLEVTSSTIQAPMLRAVATGSAVVTVLLEPRCPPEGVCHDYRKNLGAVRVTVVP
jgi:hypothetical protein